jgi:hypothetical protein
VERRQGQQSESGLGCPICANNNTIGAGQSNYVLCSLFVVLSVLLVSNRNVRNGSCEAHDADEQGKETARLVEDEILDEKKLESLLYPDGR